MDLAVTKNILDTTLVVSLAILAFSSLVFLIYLVPVFIQLTKALESANALINSVKDYTRGLSSGFNSVKDGLVGAVTKFSSVLVSIPTLVKDLFSSRK